MKDRVYGVVLAGGGGTRLWPASRRRLPKQFLPLLPGGRTLLGATVERVRELVPLERILIVTAEGQIDDVRRAVPVVPVENILVEPLARNTAPCIGLAAVEVQRRAGGAAILAVIPSDQHVAREEAYRAALEDAFAVAATGYITTIGIRPTHPETGFGYIEVGQAAVEGAHLVSRFVEKPDRETASGYLASGRYLWNSGMFFFQAERILLAMREHLPELASILDEIRDFPDRTGSLYPAAPAVSIDYGVMERLSPGEVAVVAGDFGWSDVGSWAALHEIVPRDAANNVSIGDSLAVDAHGNVVYAPDGPLVTVLGVDNLVVVATRDAVLVMPRDRAQDVREIVKALDKRKDERL